MQFQRQSAPKASIPLVDRLDYFLRSRASKVVVLALVANTMVAQLLYNSAGQLVLGNEFVVGYLLISAVCSTFAFALFEVSTIFQLHDLMALDASIKVEIGAEKLIKRGWFVLGVSAPISTLMLTSRAMRSCSWKMVLISKRAKATVEHTAEKSR